MYKKDLTAVFNPESIAVIGASREPGRIGYDVLKNIIEGGFEGEIYPVNPKATEILGKTCYPTLSDVGAPIDLAVFTVPPAVVSGVLSEAGKLGIKAAIVITAGYKEMGNSLGEEEIKAICNQYNIALIGPNCLGVISAVSKMNASFATSMPKRGTVGFLSQSGAICTAVLDRADMLGIGFSHFVSMGNKAQTDEAVLLDYFLRDSETKVVGIYVEDIAQPHLMLELIAEARKDGFVKPVIALKSGRTDVGAMASASHTGALAGKDEAYDAFFAQAGIIRAETMSNFFDLVRIFANSVLPKGNNVAIVTNAGGPGVLTTDAVVNAGLSVPALSKKTQQALMEFLPAAANTNNPVDLLGDAPADRYLKTLELLGKDEDVHSLLVLLTPQSSTQIMETAQAIVEAKHSSGKPVVAAFMGGSAVEPGARLLAEQGVPVLTFPEEGADTLAVLYAYAKSVGASTPELFTINDIDAKKGEELLLAATAGGRTGIPEAEAVGILAAYGFSTLASAVATTRVEAEQIAMSVGKPLAMKIVSDDVLHKTDAGGVRLNVDPKTAGDVYDDIMSTVHKNKPEAKLDGVLLVEMAPKNGVEVILGVVKDPALGHLLMVGLGGIYVEVLKDVAFGLAPITKRDAVRMISSLKAKRIFDGVRGGKALDTEALVDALGRLSRLIVDHPEIVELDINPLLLLEEGDGFRVLDARIIVS